MKVTFILRNLTDAFFDGFGSSLKGINNMGDLERFRHLDKVAKEMTGSVMMKVGNGSFRDKVDLNQILRNPAPKIAYKLEPRKGYRLATFEIS